ncbi:MAG: hypothetical protein H6835_15610 [Planctomycetes bacterium]|nr:hypothetical protein [Planctomycetota bacterium]
MSSVTRQRVAIVVVAALLLSFEFTVARVSAAVFGVFFFCWLVGRGRPRESVDDAAAGPGERS